MERVCGAAAVIHAKQWHWAGQKPFYHSRYLRGTLTPGTRAPPGRLGMPNRSVFKFVQSQNQNRNQKLVYWHLLNRSHVTRNLTKWLYTSSSWWLVWRWAALELSAEQRWMPTPASFTVKARAAIKKSKVGSESDAMAVTQPADSAFAAPLS